MPIGAFCWEWAWEIFWTMKEKHSFYCWIISTVLKIWYTVYSPWNEDAELIQTCKKSSVTGKKKQKKEINYSTTTLDISHWRTNIFCKFCDSEVRTNGLRYLLTIQSSKQFLEIEIANSVTCQVPLKAWHSNSLLWRKL